MDGDGGNSKIEGDGAAEGRAPDHGGWHSMTGLDAGGPLPRFHAPITHKAASVPPAQEASDLRVHPGVLKAQRVPSPQRCVCSKRGPEREQCFTLTQYLVHGQIPGTEGPWRRRNFASGVPA